jgi:glycosyltransferase involved in cell wall biosynthesis
VGASSLVSIILPVYNGERYLDQAINSCLAQTYSKWELIIVDDASTDTTPDIIDHYQSVDSRIHCVRHHENFRLPAALNTGFALAHGDLLTWTSNDNLYHPQAIAVMADFLSNHLDVDVVYTDYVRIDETGRELEATPVLPMEHLLYGNVVGACFLYRRVVQETLKFYDERLFLAEDYDFWLRASRYFKLSPLHCKLYYYRLHDVSLTKTHKIEIFLSHEKTVRENLPFLSWAKSENKVAGYMSLARKALENNLHFKIASNICISLRRYPLITLKQVASIISSHIRVRIGIY